MLRSSKRKTGKIHETSHSPQNLQQGTKSAMDPRLWHKVAAVSGVAALGLGTYGAHFFKPKNPSYKEVWHTASVYHLVHTAALLAAPITKYPTVFGVLLTSGILGFSGTCYAVAYLEDRTYSRVAPFGGFAFIGAWASLLF
ncbi:uncharacterized protein [Primulina huaijiensis]|uniref:uncharacterized protein n=1 Tax=Primulina huaijiensis TaxID=1492673 RepID=UPI003CC6FB6A